jgi:ATP phosphoribosyltransferase regulatory subunit HisZ
MDAELTHHLQRVRAHRAELKDSLGAVDDALASPLAGPQWRERVRVALAELDHDFRTHVDLTESPGGLHDDVLAGSPRLSGRVRRLTDEHMRLTGVLGGLLARLDGDGDLDRAALREEATSLIGQLVRHRQAGADLVFEAYEVDIGGDG